MTPTPDPGLVRAVLRALVSADTLAEMLQPCAQAMVDHLDAAFARIWLADDAGVTLHLVASAGMYTHTDGAHGTIPVGAFKIGHIAASRQPHLTNDVTNDPRVSDHEWAVREGMVAFAGYPLVVDQDLVGVVGMFARHEVDEVVIAQLASVADSLALGVQRKRFEEHLREDRLVIESLYRIGTALSQELDLSRLLQMVTDAATEGSGAEFGAFFYNVIDERGESYTLYSLSGVSRSAFEGFALPRATEVFAPTFHGEAPVRLRDVRADARYGNNPPHHGEPDGHPAVRSYLAVPVVGREGEVIGGLFFGHGDVGVFDERAEQVVVGIASHAAIAIENARLYELERTAAVTLQRNLLPGSLPAIPGAELTSAYLPAGHHNEIGGDWYDCVALPDGSYALTVGDVGGHDLRAAAVMGQVRTALRMSAVDSAGPAEALARLDRFHSEFGIAELATVVQAVYAPGSLVLRLASAGHPPPLLIGPDGLVSFIDVPPLPVLGYGMVAGEVARRSPSADVSIALEPGSQVLFFTDGLVERRGQSIERGLAQLASAAGAAVDLSPELLTKHLLAEMVSEDERGDDVALLLLSLSR